MKRILALILVFGILVSCISYAAEQTSEGISETLLEDEIKVLKLVGVLEEDYEFTNTDVPRGQFASFLVKSKGFKTYVEEYKRDSFSDITFETPYAKEIAAAKEMSLINGYSDGTFRPENTITLLEAGICYIRALGYGVYADAKGGYPTGYYQVLRDLKLFGGIDKNYGDTLDMQSAVRLIYNALHTKVLIQTEFGDGTNYKTENEQTLIYDSFGIKYSEGIVNGVDISNLYGENDLTPYRVYVGEEIFNATEFAMNELLGYNVRAYYIPETIDSHILLAYPLKDKNNVNIINISDIRSISDGYINIETTDGKTKKYSYSSDSPVIYNKTNTTEKFDMNIFNNSEGIKLSGEVKLLDNNGDKKADIIFIEAYEEMMVGKVTATKFLLYDYFDSERTKILNTSSNEPYVVIFDPDGEETSFSALKTGMSLTIYESKEDASQKYIRVYISNTVVTTKIISFYDDEDGRFVETEDGVYRMTDYANKYSPSVISGRTASLRLNIKGEIVRISYNVTPGDYKIALVCAVWKGKNFEDSYKIRLMDENKGISDVAVSDKIIIDNINLNVSSEKGANTFDAIMKKASLAGGFEREGAYYYQLIKYGINPDGNINYIDTVLDEAGNKMTANDIKENNEFYSVNIIDGEYLSTLSMIGEKVILPGDTAIFMVPGAGEEQDSEQYGVMDKSYFKSEQKYTTTYYSDSPDGFSAKYFLSEYKATRLGNNFQAQIVTKITQVVNHDGIPARKLYLYSRGARNEAIASGEIISVGTSGDAEIKIDDLVPGDIIHYTTNSYGELDQFIIMYKYDTDTAYQDILKSNCNNKILKAHVLQSTASGIKLAYELNMNGKTQVDDEIAAGDYTVFNNTIYTVTLIDTRTMTPKTGSYTDIIGYNENKTDYSKVIIHGTNGAASYSSRQLIREIFLYQ